ncbi:MAG: hypothetical protein JSR39_03100 [Verrucomicrobia bacterium]|nr:hypothetical protein [Verrucomicrobiota bacterium]
MADKKKIALAMVASTLVLLSNGLQANETPVEQVQEEALSYSDLGSGEEVRSNLVSQTNQSKAKQNNSRTKKTADGSCGDNSGNNSSDSTKKPADGQCGQGSCGSGSTGGSGAAKKPADGQCGQGSCGSGSTGGGNTSSNQKGKKTTSVGK